MNVRPSSGRPGSRASGYDPPVGVVRPGSGRAITARGPARAPRPDPRQPPVQGRSNAKHEQGDSKLSRWEIQEQISKGSFGVVYKAINKEDGQLYALKQVDLKGMNRADRQEAMDESRILATLDSPYITQHYESFIEDEKLNIVMELATMGSLHAKLKAQKGKGLPEDTVWRYFIEALLAVNHLHSKKIIHRDIKSLNLFLTESGDIMLGDLGIARAMSENTHFLKSLVGTPFYLSPELCNDKPYNEKSDIWALGVVLYEMCMTVHPFTAKNEGALVRKILAGVYDPPRGYSSQIVDLVRQCMTFKYQSRPDSFQLLRNPTVLRKAAELNINLRPGPRKKTAPARQKPAPPPPQRAPALQGEAWEPPQEQVYHGQQASTAQHPEEDPRRQYEAGYRRPQQLGREQPGAGSAWPEPAAEDGRGWRAPPPAQAQPGSAWPALAPAREPDVRPSAAELAAKQRHGAGGAVPGGVDPYERTPPERKAHHGDGQHQMRTAGARGQRQHAAYPYGYQDGAGGAISYEMEQRLKLAEHDAAMRAAVADGCPGYARGQHPGQQDHLGSIMKGGYAGQEDSYDWPRPGQHRAVDAHTAGRPQQMDSHRGAAPFAFDDAESSKRSGGKSDNPDLWNVSIPQHGRRRAADLAITGPSLRGNSARGGGGGANAARYDYQGAITSTTTYATPSMAPSTFFGGR